MKYLLFYTMAPNVQMSAIAEHFAEHQATWQSFQDDGTLIAIGPMANPADGALSVFSTREAAERFATNDPFVTEGLVGDWTIMEWREVLLGDR